MPTWAVGVVGSAPPWHGGGHEFESHTVHHFSLKTRRIARISEANIFCRLLGQYHVSGDKKSETKYNNMLIYKL